jgi:eukaryotic-like serine/threonine-protein kinase
MSQPQEIGRYIIETRLDGGAMADVYLAFDPLMKRKVVIKVLPRQTSILDPVYRARFEREIKLIIKLEHPAIVPVYDFGYLENLPYIVMRFMGGGTLKGRIKAGPMPLSKVLRIFQQLTPAVDYVHNNQVVHRDLKPGNILFDALDNAYIADFGIAKLSGISSSLTGEASPGTPDYMSPEQITQDDQIDARSDIYAMGVVLFEMLTGKRPFEHPVEHIIAPIPNILEILPDLPWRYEFLFQRLLAKDRNDRFESMVELTRSLVEANEANMEEEKASYKLSLPVDSESQPPITHPLEPVKSSKFPRNQLLALIGTFIVIFLFVWFAQEKFFWNGNPNDVSLTQETESLEESTPLLDVIALTNTPSPPHTTLVPIPTETPTISPSSSGSLLETDIPSQVTNDRELDIILIPESKFLRGLSIDQENYLLALCPTCKPEGLSDQTRAYANGIYLDAFWIDKTEVTNAQFARFVEMTGYVTSVEQSGKSYVMHSGANVFEYVANATWKQPSGIGSDINGKGNYPVVHVSWNDASAYCEWLGGRLPTEAEWEKAARGEFGYIFPWGDSIPDKDLLNFNLANSSVVSVGSYPPGASPYGILDMAGNVWEWVSDFYDPDYYSYAPEFNPAGPDEGEGHPIRGGSWATEAKDLYFVSTTFRLWNKPFISSNVLGFRCAYDNGSEFYSVPTATKPPIFTPTLLVDQIVDDFGVPMALIPSGEFKMGSNSVILSDFYIDKFEVTNARYLACVIAGYCEERNMPELRDPEFGNYPVSNVHWFDAQNYCEWRGSRLPTEAEWEKAARGGLQGQLYPWGNEPPVCQAGLFNGVRFSDGEACEELGPIAVGTYGANGYSLYDILGNVWEWVADWYADDYYQGLPPQIENPLGPETGSNKVVRGASWYSIFESLRLSNRSYKDPQTFEPNTGFRCAKTP